MHRQYTFTIYESLSTYILIMTLSVCFHADLGIKETESVPDTYIDFMFN